MCSIAGLIRISDLEPRNWDLKPAAAVERMIAVLRHRGPDDRGIANCEIGGQESGARGQESKNRMQVCLGNTRLSIIDLSPAGHQPMEEAGICLTYNGETYNFRELRDEIGNQFGEWRSQTDTEVVLRAYRKWGMAAFAKLRGMFALALWDDKRRELILARDPFGIKPLYYYQSTVQNPKSKGANSLVFASEVRALLASGLIPRRLSHAGVASYLSYGSVQSPLTIIEGVRSLMPGHYLTVSEHNGALKTEEANYADTMRTGRAPQRGCPAGDPARPRSQHERTLDSGRWTLDSPTRSLRSRVEAVAELREKLEESVRLHLVSDVPLGVFLSGGMDSSALVALMSRVVTEKPKTFSVVFDDHRFSEESHSQFVAEKFQTHHREIRLTEERLWRLLPDALRAMDQPTMDGVNTYVVSQAVKDAGVTVALSGLGGDELFAGYPTFQRALRLKKLAGLPDRLRRSVAGAGRLLAAGSVRQRKLWQLLESDGSPCAAYSITRQLFERDEIAALSASPRSRRFDGEQLSPQRYRAQSGFACSYSESEQNGFNDPINAISLLELRGYMANTLLRDTDFMSMTHSLEVRVPFVDAEVVRFVLGLPGEWKVNGHGPKPLLREVVKDLLPEDFLQRPKMGFTLPFEKWMQSCLRDEIDGVFKDDEHLSSIGIEAEAVREVWRQFLHLPRNVGWSRPWSLYVLAKWCKNNGVTATDSTD